MAKEFAKAFYNSSRWRKCRTDYIASVGGLCERHDMNDPRPGYILHHKIKLTPGNINDDRITLNPEHLEYVCLECHNADELGEHKNLQPKRRPRRCTFDREGNIIPPIKLL